ncbi:hypothetical protein LMG19087_02153 [Ralstonia wenshanensis]|uniref:helix-turn-helix transcriptional regulator n=1 Tax=Ralstonia wenshanensis TaxID=2842456 RepID=UPI0028F67FE7|nr:helix-turn-helix transcriptional regulator [Ralstonia wenshanensis]CAJ0814590.1 hypothetical protein LMG19087_02153 [Ralstonia wenshanensis]
MSYQELIAKAMKGRSVNALAKALHVPQPTMRNYCNGDRLPDYVTAAALAKEAGVEMGEMFIALVEEEAKKKGITAKIAEGFKKLLSLANPRQDWIPGTVVAA